MSIDRKKLLQQRSNALEAASRQELPQRIRDKAQKAANLAGIALGLQDAQQRKAERDGTAPSEHQGSQS